MRRLVLLGVVVAAFAGWIAPSAFGGVPNSLMIQGAGNGSGLVTGFRLDCQIIDGVAQTATSDCIAENIGGELIVSATPVAGSQFTVWQNCAALGGVPNFNVCTITPAGDELLISQFNATDSTLVVTKSGTGTATVTSSPGGINCGPTCSATFANTPVTLTVSLGPGTTFNGWGGACAPSGRNLVCIVSMIQNQGVSISTSLVTFPLTVTTAGNGTGTVTSTPSGIVCPATCAASVVAGTTVTLTANPSAGSVFSGFSGACTGNSCALTVTSAASVTATFAPEAVEAAVVGNKIRKTGPRKARRVLSVTIDADQEIRIVMRIQRGGVTLQTRRVRSFGPETGIVRFPIRNGIAAGRARLLVTMTNEDGVSKSQTRRLRVPTVS